MKTGLDFFYFVILRAPSEISANLLGHFADFLALGNSNSEEAYRISK